MLHKRARYCPLCSEELQGAPVEGRERPRCKGCGFVYFFNPACASAAAVIDQDDRVLLIQRRIEPFQGQWALPAGYQEVDEDPRDTALREVLEETGIEAKIDRLFDVVWVPDDPRKPANVLVYLCTPVGGELRAASDAKAAAWFHLDDLPEPIGFGNAEAILSRLPRRGV